MLKDILKDKEPLVTIEPDAKVGDAARLMAEHDVGCILVLSNDKPRGMLTDRDIVIRCIAKNIDVNDCTVENIMTESLATSKDTDGFFDCIQKMHDNRVRRIPVVDNSGKAIGIVSFGDLIAVLSKELVALSETTTPLEEYQEQTKAA